MFWFWLSGRNRHYQRKVTYRDDNVENYTVRSRSWGGPYATPSKGKDHSWRVIGIIAVILAPWMLPISSGATEIVACFWYIAAYQFFKHRKLGA